MNCKICGVDIKLNKDGCCSFECSMKLEHKGQLHKVKKYVQETAMDGVEHFV